MFITEPIYQVKGYGRPKYKEGDPEKHAHVCFCRKDAGVPHPTAAAVWLLVKYRHFFYEDELRGRNLKGHLMLQSSDPRSPEGDLRQVH